MARDPMAESADRFRDALAHLVGGVTIVTSRGIRGEPHGLTATAVASVSLEPPLVMACVGKSSHTHGAIEASGVFAVNFLARSGQEMATRFSRSGEDKYEDVEVRYGVTGAPLLPHTMAYCDCTVVEVVPAGDHTLFIGRVEQAGADVPERDESGAEERSGGQPLLYYRGRYAGLVELGTE